MVDINATIFPLWGSIGTLVNTIKVLIGGAFGLYLIILYFRVREYIVVRRLLLNVQQDIRVLADKQGIELPSSKRPPTVTAYVLEKIKQRAERKAAIKKSALKPAKKSIKKTNKGR